MYSLVSIWCTVIAVIVMSAGCALRQDSPQPLPPKPAGISLSEGDMVEVNFSGVNSPPESMSERIKEDGTITLTLIGPIKVVGLKPGELQRKIHDLYVPDYYKYLTVTVKAENRLVYITGEVKNPSRQIYSGEMTVLKAINAAGGFTDFANRSNVKIIRANGETEIVDCKDALDNPSLDLPVYPNDQIVVPRRII